MARTKGMLNLSGNLEVNAGAPLDARTVVPTLADLTVAANFQYKYVGMPVVVAATGDMYILTANDVTVAANWKQVGSGGGGSSYTAGDGIDITNDEISVKAGSNLSFDSSGNLNATDTTYTAGTGINITNNVISATGGGGTSYTAGDGIDITNNVISVDEMASADMSEIIDPLPSVMSRLPRYSTEEQIVGYWTDGKPIYQKTYIISSVTSSNKLIDSTMKLSAITLRGFISNGIQMGGNYNGSTFVGSITASCSLRVWNDTNGLYCNLENASITATEARFTVQYTKTTD